MKGLSVSSVPYHEYIRNGASTPENKSKYNIKVQTAYIKNSYERNKRQIKGIVKDLIDSV